MTDTNPDIPDEGDGGEDLVDVFKLSRYRKVVTAVIIGLIVWGGTVVTSPEAYVTAQEWLGLAGVAAIGFGVYRIPNTP